ncbi:MAG: L,D-transpeptidase [Cetobacterium sp.]
MNKRLMFLIWGLMVTFVFSVTIEKELIYDKYTLKDNYKYGKVDRKIQWEKISNYLDKLEDFEKGHINFGYVQNYKNMIGTPGTIDGKTVDGDGVSRNQAVPLYSKENPQKLINYGRDGGLVTILNKGEKTTLIKGFDRGREWYIPNKYLKSSPVKEFTKVIFVDRKNQNIVTMEKVGNVWKARSINPVTTGRDKPPYSLPTPLGTYVVQQKKIRMDYYADGTTTIGGYAPNATRFTRGAYIHGIPINLPATAQVEYSPTLGTIPRSHMCVRNATSHAKYIYNWSKIGDTLVFVIE